MTDILGARDMKKKRVTGRSRVREKREDNLRGMDISLKHCGIAADALGRAFIWGASKEGHKFWADIHARLSQLSNRWP